MPVSNPLLDSMALVRGLAATRTTARTLHCARSSYVPPVPVRARDIVEPGDVGHMVDEIFPGHPERNRLIAAILDQRHEDARRIASAYVSPVARAFARLAREVAA